MGNEGRLSLSVRAVTVLAVFGLITGGFAAGYAFGHQGDWPNNSSVQVVMRYNDATGWFEVREDGVLATEWTATELGIEGVPDPDGWSRHPFLTAKTRRPAEASLSSSGHADAVSPGIE